MGAPGPLPGSAAAAAAAKRSVAPTGQTDTPHSVDNAYESDLKARFSAGALYSFRCTYGMWSAGRASVSLALRSLLCLHLTQALAEGSEQAAAELIALAQPTSGRGSMMEKIRRFEAAQS